MDREAGEQLSARCQIGCMHVGALDHVARRGVELDAQVGVGGAEVAGGWAGVDAAPADFSVGG